MMTALQLPIGTDPIAVFRNREVDHVRASLDSRRGDYRVLVQIISEDHVLLIGRIEHRADVYRPHQLGDGGLGRDGLSLGGALRAALRV